jgi:hypothetical protein
MNKTLLSNKCHVAQVSRWTGRQTHRIQNPHSTHVIVISIAGSVSKLQRRSSLPCGKTQSHRAPARLSRTQEGGLLVQTLDPAMVDLQLLRHSLLAPRVASLAACESAVPRSPSLQPAVTRRTLVQTSGGTDDATAVRDCVAAPARQAIRG